MATINNATRLGVPGLADTGDIEQDSLAIGLAQQTGLLTDTLI